MKMKLVACAALALAMTVPPALAAPADGMQIAIERKAAEQPLVDQAALEARQVVQLRAAAGGKLVAIAEASAAAAVPRALQAVAAAGVARVDREVVAFHLRL